MSPKCQFDALDDLFEVTVFAVDDIGTISGKGRLEAVRARLIGRMRWVIATFVGVYAAT